MESNLYYHISIPNTYTVCPKPCVLHSIIVSTTSAGAITINDGTAFVAILKANITEDVYVYDVDIKNSLIVTTGDASDITVTYRPSA